MATMEEGFFVEDCVAFMSRMDEASIDLTVTSPPDVVFFNESSPTFRHRCSVRRTP